MVGHVHYIDHVFIFRVSINAGIVPGTLAQIAIFIDFYPLFTAIVGAEHAARLAFYDGENPVRPRRAYRNANDTQGVFGQSFIAGYFCPAIAAVGAFPESAARAAAG